MKQATLQTFGKPPLPRGYSPSHVLTYRKCEYLFLLIYIYKVFVESKFKPKVEGSSIHKDISEGKFTSDDPIKQNMLNIALEFLTEMPANPTFETSIEDKNNPGVYKGTVCNAPFLAVFDVHWVYDRVGADWKRSEHKEKYDGEYEIQAYILNELFKQKYGQPLKKFYFVFLKDGFRYEAQSIYDGAVRKRTEKKIYNMLDGVKKLQFKKKQSWACEWCECQGMCI